MNPTAPSSLPPTPTMGNRDVKAISVSGWKDVLQRHPDAFMAAAVRGGLILGWVLKRR